MAARNPSRPAGRPGRRSPGPSAHARSETERSGFRSIPTDPSARGRRRRGGAGCVVFAAPGPIRRRGVAAPARRALLAHDWPGNVRELRNAIERAVVLAEDDVIRLTDLPSGLAGQPAALRPAEAALGDLTYAEARTRALEAFEQSFLTAALERHGGNISAAARALGLHRQSLQKMLRRIGRGPARTGE